MRGNALQILKNINGPTQENLGEILAIFRKPQSKTVTPIPLTQTAASTIITTTTTTVTEPKESQKLSIHSVILVGRQIIPQRNAIMEPMQPIDHLPGREGRKDKIRSKKEPIKMTQMKLLRLQPKI